MNKFFNISIVCPEPGHFATVTTDLTDFHRARNLIADKNKELENYLFVASHDLRSPLVNIQGFSARLERQIDELDATVSREYEDPVDKKAEITNLRDAIKKSLRFISANTAKMDRLINGLLMIARTGRIEMRIKNINMNALFAGIAQSVSFETERAGVRLEVESLLDCWGDESLICQLFSNLVDNAIKYRASSRPLVINVSSVPSSSGVTYRVRDNGIGIAERCRDRIWEVFFRANPCPDLPGDGIGLSIVKRIAEKHQGKAWLESQEGVGTTFFVQLPSAPFTEIA
jgi:signal transduction histidine kinase